MQFAQVLYPTLILGNGSSKAIYCFLYEYFGLDLAGKLDRLER